MGLRDFFKSRYSSQSVGDPVTRSKPKPKRGDLRWVPAGETVDVQGHKIPGGMIYVGSGVRSLTGPDIEPCLIDPNLSVRWNKPDSAGATMGYWPAYNKMDPRSRAGYLTWLANGRRNEAAYIGYVFVFFYGLERRVLADIEADTNHPDLPTITAELKRLLGIYGDNRSLNRYANGLLEYIEAMSSMGDDMEPPVWAPGYQGWEVPIAVLAGVGWYVADGLPIPGDWALSYLRHHPEGYLRTPATRCQDEFDRLFLIRYQDKFGDGIKVPQPARRLKFSYRPASGGISGEAEVTVDSIPDISGLSGPINKLKDLGAECTDELDAYSRFLGRRPDESGSVTAISLLPEELLDASGIPLLDDLREWTKELLGTDLHAVVPLDDLIGHCSLDIVEKPKKRDAVVLASILGKIGVGIEPDVRFGAATPKPGTSVVLFSLPKDSPAAPSSAYTAALSLVHLTGVVAAADGRITEPEQQHLAAHAEDVLGLDASERARLDAHLVFLAAGKLSMAGIKKKVGALPPADRVAVGRFLVDVAAADGVVSPEEISILTKLFTYLGLEEADVYSQVHALGTGDSGPITVRDAESTTRWTVPSPATGEAVRSGPIPLDPAKVKARLAETAHVAALLAGIFAEDDTQPQPIAAGAMTSSSLAGESASSSIADSTITGLDVAHSALAVALAASPSWSRSEAEQLAASVGLPLLDGALDRINEAAMDACGEPLAEGDEDLEMNAYAIEEML